MSEIHAAVGSYVVDALDEADRSEFHAHLATCPTCRIEVGELSETVAELAWLVQRPVPRVVRRSVLSHVNEVRPLPPLPGSVPLTSEPAVAVAHPITATPVRRRPRRRVASFALAAALVAVVGLGGAVVTLDQQRQDQVVTSQAQTRLLTAADAKVYTNELGNGADVSFVVSKSLDQAMFLAKDLPPVDAQHAYQLWSMTARGAVPSTVFSTSGDVQVWMKPGIRTGNGVALTVEPAGGSTLPTTQPLVIETL